MHKLFKIPLIFLFVSACLGLFLRFQLLNPLPGIVYSYVLHAHSHVMFLGWVFNVLILAFTMEFALPKNFNTWFWLLQCCVVGMLFSFPFQGYGPISITFSSLHTLGALAFIIMFLSRSKGQSQVSLIYIRAALLFFVLSSIGPFFLGYLKASGLQHDDLYRNTIYFYLHFQYNGFFLFGILGLFVRLIEKELSSDNLRQLKRDGYIMIISCIPAFLLSTLWARPGIAVNIIAGTAALTQLIALIRFMLISVTFLRRSEFRRDTRLLFSLSFVSLALKSILQLASAHPGLAAFANEYRAIVIAYLHLVLVGGISLFLMGWLIQKKYVQFSSRLPVPLIITGFVISELVLIASPWSKPGVIIQPNFLNAIVFFCSVMMVCGFGMVARNAVKKMTLTTTQR